MSRITDDGIIVVMIKELTQLGLSENEAKVYLAVLKLGSSNAGPIVRETRLHRMFVYAALKHLEELRLVSVIIRNNRQYFQATNPENILTPLQDKERLAEKLIPELKALQSEKDHEMGVRMFYGKEGFWDNLQDVIRSAAKFDRIMYIIGGAPDTAFYEAIGKHYQAYKQLLKSQKVAKWLLAPEAMSSEFRMKFAKETPKNQLRTLPRGLSSPTYTRITPEMVSIEIYTSPLFIIQIKNKSIAESYKEHFNLLWQAATKE